jgi:hypothetical protein
MVLTALNVYLTCLTTLNVYLTGVLQYIFLRFLDTILSVPCLRVPVVWGRIANDGSVVCKMCITELLGAKCI